MSIDPIEDAIQQGEAPHLERSDLVQDKAAQEAKKQEEVASSEMCEPDAALRQSKTPRIPKQGESAENGKLESSSLNTKKLAAFFSRSGEKNSLKTNSISQLLVPLSNLNVHISEHTLQDSAMWLNRLNQDRLIVLTSLHHELALYAAQTLSHSIISTDTGMALLDFERKEVEEKSPLFNEVAADDFSPCLIVIDAVMTKGDSFLHSLFTMDENEIKRLCEDLVARDRYLLCICPYRFFHHKVKEDHKKCFCKRFGIWEIEFLKNLLKIGYPTEYNHYYQEILRQRIDGKWSFDEEEFYEDVMGNLFQIPEEIEAREERPSIASQRNSLMKNLLDDQDPFLEIKKSVLYVAAFFPELSVQDFKRIVEAMLYGKIVRIPGVVRKIGEDGKQVIEENFEERSLLELWQKTGDKFLTDCRLERVRFKDGRSVIEFTAPFLRREVREHMSRKHPIFMEEQFERIKQFGLLFNSSGRVVENTISLAVDMAISNFEHHGKSWLIGMLHDIHLMDSNQAVGGLDVSSDQLVLLEIFRTAKKHFIYARIAYLLREMIERGRLHDRVKELLNQLIDERLHEALLHIVMQIRLTDDQFDEMYWLKQLLDRGGTEVRESTSKALFRYIGHDSPKLYTLLSKTVKWLPELSRPEKDYSASNRFALRFIFEYCSEEIANFDGRSYGKWPPELPIFKQLNPYTHEIVESNCRVLVEWLCHPGVQYLFAGPLVDDNGILTAAGVRVVSCLAMVYGSMNEEVMLKNPALGDTIALQVFALEQEMSKEAQAAVLLTLAAFLLSWAAIIYGPEKDSKPADAAVLILEVILSHIAHLIGHDKKARRNLLSTFQTFQQFLLEGADVLEISYRQERRQLMRRRKLISGLMYRLKELMALEIKA